MIFKEESILLMILLETFSQDDWLTIAHDSAIYGYAIITPTEEWIPHREDFEQNADNVDAEETVQDELTKVIKTSEGEFTISFKPNKKEEIINRDSQQKFGEGYLSVEQI